MVPVFVDACVIAARLSAGRLVSGHIMGNSLHVSSRGRVIGRRRARRLVEACVDTALRAGRSRPKAVAERPVAGAAKARPSAPPVCLRPLRPCFRTFGCASAPYRCVPNHTRGAVLRNSVAALERTGVGRIVVAARDDAGRYRYFHLPKHRDPLSMVAALVQALRGYGDLRLLGDVDLGTCPIGS